MGMMTMQTLTLKDVYTSPETLGIFNGFVSLEVPWQGERIATNLNLLYYYMHSGDKAISPLLEHYLDSDNTISETSNSRIAELIYNVCGVGWTKVYNALNADYSPIENVDGYVSETTTSEDSKTANSTHSDSGTVINAKSGADTLKHSGTDTDYDSGTVTNAKSGSDTETHAGTDTTTDNGTVTTAKSGDDTLTRTGTDTTAGTGSVKHEDSGEDKTVTSDDTTVYHHQYLLNQETPTGTTTTQNSVYGFNSENDVNDNKSVTTLDQKTRTITRTLSVQTDSNGDPVLDSDGNEIDRDGKNSDRTDGKVTETVTHGKAETETRDTTDTRTLDTADKTAYNSTDTETRGLTTEETRNLSDKTEYGSTDTETRDITNKRTIDLTDTTSYGQTDTNTLDTKHVTDSAESGNGKVTHEMHRHGNIGVTTNQQMINEEIELRKTKFFSVVFNDIDRFLTLSVY